MKPDYKLEIRPNEVIVNGVRYIPNNTIPNKISIYLMKDNHTFIKIQGTTPEEIISDIKKTYKLHSDANTGSIYFFHDNKEVAKHNIKITELDKLEELLNQEGIINLLFTTSL